MGFVKRPLLKKPLIVVLKSDTCVSIMRTGKSDNSALSALFNGTCVLLLSFLYGNPGREFYLREIARNIGAAAGSVQREIGNLVLAGLVVKSPHGKQVYYRANTNSPVYSEIRGLIIKTFGLSGVVKDALGPVSKEIVCAFIYGSQADGTATAESDVDLMVIGNVGEMELHKIVKKAEAQLGKAINYSLFSPKEFRRRKNDKKGFINRIVSGRKIMIIGDENEV